jgi:tRNA1Val (adenine37-N6)-methyltransferase
MVHAARTSRIYRLERQRFPRDVDMATLIGGALDDNPSFRSTRDALFGGGMVLFQPQRGEGYRTNVDALLLAGFAAASRPAFPRPIDDERAPRALPLAYDLGAGVGAVGLSLLRFGAAGHVVFIEIDEAPAEMARRNLAANGWSERGEVVQADVQDVARMRQGEAELVVCNPPYIQPGRGRASPAEARARVGDLSTFVQAARQLAGRRARVCFIYPAADLATLLSTLEAQGLHPKRLRLVHATPSARARVALVEARPGRAGGLMVLPPLVERTSQEYTPELRSLLVGE